MANQKWSSFQKPSDADLKTIIQSEDGTKVLVDWANKIGEALAHQLTTSQIRAIFGEVRRIEGDWKINPKRAYKNLILLKPKMAYRAKKERGKGVGDLVAVLDPAIDYVDGKEENFTRFVEFFEAILAYHKYYGGRSN